MSFAQNNSPTSFDSVADSTTLLLLLLFYLLNHCFLFAWDGIATLVQVLLLCAVGCNHVCLFSGLILNRFYFIFI